MTIYYSVTPDITPAMLDWARKEAAQRKREESEIRTPSDLCDYKRRRGLRRRDTGLSRDMIRRLLEIVENESQVRVA